MWLGRAAVTLVGCEVLRADADVGGDRELAPETVPALELDEVVVDGVSGSLGTMEGVIMSPGRVDSPVTRSALCTVTAVAGENKIERRSPSEMRTSYVAC